MSKKHLISIFDEFCIYAPVVAGSFGGMAIMRGMYNNNVFQIILGISVIFVNMLVNKFNQHELVKKD